MTEIKVTVPDELAAWLESRASRYGGDLGAAAAAELNVARGLAESGSAQLSRALKITEPALRRLAEVDEPLAGERCVICGGGDCGAEYTGSGGIPEA
jgi:hypothetical protein